ncbi:MAG: galactokinase [Nocardioides sp.]
MPHLPPGDPRDLVASTRDAFVAAYAAEPTVVGHAPGRVNLIGEHTDYNGGLCLPVALPHRTYVAAAPRGDSRVRIASRQLPDAWEGTLDEVGPGAVPGWAAYAVGVLWALRQTGVDVPGADLFVDSTVPLGAGLSSSAALECAVAMAAMTLVGEPVTAERRQDLVTVCMQAETEIAGAPTGGMDQTVSLLALPDTALLIDFTSGTSRAVLLGPDAPQLLVMDTSVSHTLNDGGYASRRRDCEEAARLLGLPTLRTATEGDLARLGEDRLVRRARHVVTEIVRVSETVDAVDVGSWATVGRLFGESHASLRDDFEVSCAELDLAVEAAVGAGALGARLTGGGFGGSAIALVEAAGLDQVAEAVSAAFVAVGWTPPTTLVATPSGPAEADSAP